MGIFTLNWYGVKDKDYYSSIDILEESSTCLTFLYVLVGILLLYYSLLLISLFALPLCLTFFILVCSSSPLTIFVSFYLLLLLLIFNIILTFLKFDGTFFFVF